MGALGTAHRLRLRPRPPALWFCRRNLGTLRGQGTPPEHPSDGKPTSIVPPTNEDRSKKPPPRSQELPPRAPPRSPSSFSGPTDLRLLPHPSRRRLRRKPDLPSGPGRGPEEERARRSLTRGQGRGSPRSGFDDLGVRSPPDAARKRSELGGTSPAVRAGVHLGAVSTTSVSVPLGSEPGRGASSAEPHPRSGPGFTSERFRRPRCPSPPGSEPASLGSGGEWPPHAVRGLSTPPRALGGPRRGLGGADGLPGSPLRENTGGRGPSVATSIGELKGS